MSAAVEQAIQGLLAQSVQDGLLDDQFLQLIQLQVGHWGWERAGGCRHCAPCRPPPPPLAAR